MKTGFSTEGNEGNEEELVCTGGRRGSGGNQRHIEARNAIVLPKGEKMSKETQHDISCPRCGNMQATTIWESLNVTIDPELKKKLFAGEINLFECKKCGEKQFINSPLLYNDMTQQFCVHYLLFEALDDENFCRQFNPDGSTVVTGMQATIIEKTGAGYLVKPHIVFDLVEMVRYVAFRDRIAVTAKA